MRRATPLATPFSHLSEQKATRDFVETPESSTIVRGNENAWEEEEEEEEERHIILQNDPEYNAQWLELKLLYRGVVNPKVEIRKRFGHPEMNLKVDVFHRDPLVLLKVKTWVLDMSDLEDFIELGKQAETYFGEKPDMGFSCFSIHRAIRAKFLALAEENGIWVVHGSK
ncbi:hypothetical protein HDU96_009750 [Phlyctochytrium bullatum]|nr:hypothetical protein HDU96_009750 [Phlyctochytrium bullatum]